jgi:hypothetical protein
MVFDAIRGLDSRSRSFAIFCLAGTVTWRPLAYLYFILISTTELVILDNLMKIAHFPTLRDRFKSVFREIHESRQEHYYILTNRGYQVFQFKDFLRKHLREEGLLAFVQCLLITNN